MDTAVPTQQSMEMSRELELTRLLTQWNALPARKKRAVGGILGSCCADAATRPVHWLYDQNKLDATIESNDPAFWPVNLSPYYNIPTGQNSCYYDLGYLMVRTLSQVGPTAGVRDVKASYCENLLNYFGSGTEYAAAFSRRNEKYDPTKRYENREPVDGPWQQVAVTMFLEEVSGKRSGITQQQQVAESLESGLTSNSGLDFSEFVLSGNADSRETDGLVSTLPYILLSCSDESFCIADQRNAHTLQESVRTLASILSSNSFALRHTLSSAMILGDIIATGIISLDSMLTKIDQVDEDLFGSDGKCDQGVIQDEFSEIAEAAATWLPTKSVQNHVRTVARWGKPCANPGSFMGAMLAVLTAESFAEGIRCVIRAGGCNCSRANLAGACLGASFGFELPTPLGELGQAETIFAGGSRNNGIPFEWLMKTDKSVEVLTLALNLVNAL